MGCSLRCKPVGEGRLMGQFQHAEGIVEADRNTYRSGEGDQDIC